MSKQYEGVVGIIRSGSGYLLLPNGKENCGKREKYLCQTEFVLVSGRENLGGKVEEGETKPEALKHEVWQEGWIPLFDSQIISADFGVIVQQEERGAFDVSVYFLSLFWWQKLILTVFKGARTIGLNDISSDNTRMRDYQIIQLVEGNI